MARLPLLVAAAFLLANVDGHFGLTAMRAALNSAAASDDLTRELAGCFGFDCLKKYVSFDDGAFSWRQVGNATTDSLAGRTFTSYTLNMSSQAWMANESDRRAWSHILTVVVPSFLSQGDPQRNPWRSLAGFGTLLVNEPVAIAEEMALRTGTIAVALSNDPNADIDFPAYGMTGMDEEMLKAWSWSQFARHPDHPEWPIEMPAVKAVVRAMDAVAAFTSQASGSGIIPAPVERFIVSGASKRGIASYMAGALDGRVAAIVPVSHPINLDVQGADSFRNLGHTVDAAAVYDANHIMDISGERLKRLKGIIDPYSFIDKLTMPTLVLLCGNDDFFAPDSTRSWWAELPARNNYFYMYGNAPHTGYTPGTNDFLDVASAFIVELMLERPMPQIDWQIDNETGAISVSQVSDHVPTSVELWVSHTVDNTSRDFRKSEWTSQELKPRAPDSRRWEASVEPQAGHWSAFYVTFAYDSGFASVPPVKTSTEVSVVPNSRPYKLPPSSVRANYLFR